MKHQTEVQQLRFQRRVRPVLTGQVQEILSCTELRVRIPQCQRMPHVIMRFRLIRIRRDRGELRDHLDTLAQGGIEIELVRGGIIRVRHQHRTRDAVHDILARGTDNRIFLKEFTD